MSKDTYLTLAEPCTGELKDRGSKFIAYGFSVEDEEDVKARLEEVKQEHFKARHHCYAYRLGINGKLYRANDDGEPSSTAGRPILGQIDSFGLTHTLVVVVRYFGGTKLGTSGLKNAYKGAAREALSTAKIKKEIVKTTFQVTFEYAQTSDVMNFLKSEGYRILNEEYKPQKTVMQVAVRLNEVEQFSKHLKKIDQLQLKELE